MSRVNNEIEAHVASSAWRLVDQAEAEELGEADLNGLPSAKAGRLHSGLRGGAMRKEPSEDFAPPTGGLRVIGRGVVAGEPGDQAPVEHAPKRERERVG